MSEIKDLPDEIKQIARDCIGLRQHNAAMMSRLEEVGLNIEVANAHLEFVMEALVEAEVLTLEQKWKIDLAWEYELRRQLQVAEQRVMQVMQDQRNKVAQQLAVPQKPHLIVPGRD